MAERTVIPVFRFTPDNSVVAREEAAPVIGGGGAGGGGGGGDGGGGEGGDGGGGSYGLYSRIVRASTSFAALRGEGYLIGYTGYWPDGYVPSGPPEAYPWNAGPVRKWQKRRFNGTVRSLYYGDGVLICWAPAVYPYTAVSSGGYAFSEYSAVDAAGTTIAFGSAVPTSYGTFGDPQTGACNITTGAAIQANSLSPFIGAPQFPPVTSLRARTLAGVPLTSSNPYSQWSTNANLGGAAEFLCQPSTEYDALIVSGAPSVADELTMPGNYDNASPTDQGSLHFGYADPVTAVRVAFDFSGLVVSNNYTATAVVELFSLAGDPLGEFCYEEFDFQYTGAPVTYDVAIYPGYRSRCRYCYLSTTSVCAGLL